MTTLPASLRAQIDFCLLNIPTFDANSGMVQGMPELDRLLGELTSRFTRSTFDLAEDDLQTYFSVDAALAASQRSFCLLQNAGHLFTDGPDLVSALNNALAECRFLTGHIMERGGYYYLHDQCMLIDRRVWTRLSRPQFGTPATGRPKVMLADRSPTDVHDTYTPHFLDTTGIEIPLQGIFGYGWNAISTSLSNSLRVNNWSDAMRRHKRHCYAYYGNPQEWLTALSAIDAAPPTADPLLAGIIELLRLTPPPPRDG